MSKTLNLNGNIVNLNSTRNGVPFFRKKTTNELEMTIARKLKKNPHPNIVKIYEVGPNYIDMELLDTVSVNRQVCLQHAAELRRAKRHMHRNGIVYLDWKPDNIGISLLNGAIKVFDFDMSALLRRRVWYVNQWNLRPEIKGYLWRNAETAGMTSPVKIDDWIFEKKLIR